ncbi:hypothetical protein N5C16_13790 [Stenotrophomonas sp. GD03908]|uniref:Uncharacterized protein n=1 Tax=Stenotrophomonas maltophilia TaxID=40324 RepID=A0AAJ2TSS4_STEMA|nr:MULTISPECIES: hypothetical protein [Stenotrophomonas]MBH1483546.1 hypothetical protein [Stenotrophomonas maltophilia]MCU1061426.1 hypothetical protein [Stenotrophomonas maltophilia]MDH0980344.1 hypothetical protein [Stenotrophomonas sp. GD03908]MDQ7293283.1 hypothetical protein [Stenotrophomonas sp. Sm0041]MDZ5766791.1 hypothetical protein [Stenotrophomonas maltophilia]
MNYGFCLRVLLAGVPLLVAMPAVSARTAPGLVPDPVQAFILETVLADEVRAFHDGHPTYLVPASVSRTRTDAEVMADLRAEFNRFYQGQPKPRKEVAHMAILVSQTALLLPDRSACSTDQVRCHEAVMGVRTRDDEASLQVTLQAFQDAGLDLTTLGGPTS